MNKALINNRILVTLTYLSELISRTRLSQPMFSSNPLCNVPWTSFWNTEGKRKAGIKLRRIYGFNNVVFHVYNSHLWHHPIQVTQSGFPGHVIPHWPHFRCHSLGRDSTLGLETSHHHQCLHNSLFKMKVKWSLFRLSPQMPSASSSSSVSSRLLVFHRYPLPSEPTSAGLNTDKTQFAHVNHALNIYINVWHF